MVAIEARQNDPPTPKSFSHKSCWFDGQGHKICGDWSATSHNLTGIHRQDGVSDLHNEHDSKKNETIHGVTFKDDPTHPNAQFQGHKEDDSSGFRDAHDDQDEWTDHKEDSGHNHQDWKLNGTKGEDFWYDDQRHNVSDTVDSKTDGTSDVTTEDADQGAFEADFNVDNPGAQHDEDGSLVGQHRSKHQFEQHSGPDWYDSHEESNDQTVASGSFDTFDGAKEAMEDFDEHIDMPEEYGLPWEQKKEHKQGKREADAMGEWKIGNVNKFDLALSTKPAGVPANQLLHARTVEGMHDGAMDGICLLGMFTAAICLLCIVMPLAAVAFCVLSRRKKRAEAAKRSAARANELLLQGRGAVELQGVRAQEKSGDVA